VILELSSHVFGTAFSISTSSVWLFIELNTSGSNLHSRAAMGTFFELFILTSEFHEDLSISYKTNNQS
jgi:hypothetical protein